MTNDLLIEIGTEELPPKSIQKLSLAFANAVEAGLQKSKFTFSKLERFATPRRLALIIHDLLDVQPAEQVNRKGPAVKAAFDADGNPTPAALGFAKSCGVAVEELQKQATEQGEWLVYSYEQQGKTIQEVIPELINKALNQLPIGKRMRWGSGSVEFARPVHWAVLLYGDTVIPAKILELDTSNQTYGHRFHHPEALTITDPKQYPELLATKAKVIADFTKRQELIRSKVVELAQNNNAEVIIPEALLEEVTGLVEWPVPLLASFAERFLEVPEEALISAMHDHQKCFHLLDSSGKMLAKFITVSNIESSDEQQVIVGNERVMRARLSDAEFFYTTDLKHSLEYYLEKLQHVVFQAKLGTLHDKTERVIRLAKRIAEEINADPELTERAARLCKADLATDMVGEFPELQGIMGDYYARHEHEPKEVATAIREHYLPRFSKDQLPQTKAGIACAIADRIDTLVGIFGINKVPTGDKDPFALRRGALGVLRIILERQLPLNVLSLIDYAVKGYQHGLPNTDVAQQTFDFILDRLKTWYLDQGINGSVFLSVMAKRPESPLDFEQRIQAVEAFRKLPEAESLAAANKRVSKLLVKEKQEDIKRDLDISLFTLPAEQDLANLIKLKQETVEPLFAKAQYREALTDLAQLREPVDRFFDEVMVMVDDQNVRNNRLALLANLRDLFLHVADLSVL